MQIEMIQYIHQIRSPLLDQFFKLLNYFDRLEFFFVLIPIVWLWFGWKWGLRLFYILLLSYFTNHSLKEFFGLPRPFHVDPSVGVIEVKGFGFPSGTGQNVILLSGILLTNWKSHWRFFVAAIYSLLISFSRIYLGLHYFTDILGGWGVGFFLFLVFRYIFPLIEKRLHHMSPLSLFALSQIVPLLLLFWCSTKNCVQMVSIAMGFAIGVLGIYSNQLFLEKPKSYFSRAVVGVLGAFLFYGALTLIPMENANGLKFLALAIWTALGNQLLCKKLAN
jgi:undecaprenyl-diphosphatase